MTTLELTDNYKEVLHAIKERVRTAQYKALHSVNHELIALYWDIGRIIAEQQQEKPWGQSVVERLAKDLQVEFPGVKGFSGRNVWYMRTFYLAYKGNKKLQQLVAEIGWGHNLMIMAHCKTDAEREFYIQQAAEQGLSRGTLSQNIQRKAYERSLNTQTNFASTVPETRRAEALLAVKDDYNFDFLDIAEEHKERELEEALVSNITRFLAEMGNYFAFVGRQIRVEVDEKEFFVDLVFYHRKLKCLVAIELKTTEFQPSYAGQMTFYLSALDDQLRVEGENPSIGIIICKGKSRTIVEYTLRGETRPIGVATYNRYASLKELPAQIAQYLPSENQIEETLAHIPSEAEQSLRTKDVPKA